MTDGELLLRNVLEEPAEDAARLVYADWLEENGDEKAAQVIRDGVFNPDKRTMHLLADLDLVGVGLSCCFLRRGMCESVSMRTDDFFNHATELFSNHPVEWVSLLDFRMRLIGETGLRIQVNQMPEKVTFHTHSRAHYLPIEFKDLLVGGFLVNGYGDRDYLTEDVAKSDLSQACVRYGRMLVGLTDRVAAQVG